MSVCHCEGRRIDRSTPVSSSADVGAVAIPYNRFDAVPDHDNRPPTALVRQLTVRLCATDAPARHH